MSFFTIRREKLQGYGFKKRKYGRICGRMGVGGSIIFLQVLLYQCGTDNTAYEKKEKRQ